MAGKPVPRGFHEWERIPKVVFAPSTKAAQDHDDNILVERYLTEMKEKGKRTIDVFAAGYCMLYAHCLSCGIRVVDSKMEGNYACIADEAGTPNCCRMVLEKYFEHFMRYGGKLVFRDKEAVREWGNGVVTPFGVGIQLLNPTNPQHLMCLAFFFEKKECHSTYALYKKQRAFSCSTSSVSSLGV